MMNSGSSSGEPAVNWDFDLDNVDFDSLFEDQLAVALTDSGASVKVTPINPSTPSQPSMPSIYGGTNLGGESPNAENINQSQLQLKHATGTMGNHNQLQQATRTSRNQNKLKLQQATGSSGNQNRLQLQHAARTLGNQNQLQLQRATRTSSYMISGGGHQQGNYINLNFSGPNGFSTPGQFLSGTAYHQYLLRQIKVMKERYYNELLKMHYNVVELCTRATNMDDSNYYKNVMGSLERIMTFLHISRADMLPLNDQMIYNTMNTIVNYVSYHMNKPSCYSLHRGPAQQPPNGPLAQPLGATRLQYNPSQSATNVEANKWKFNSNYPSRRPHPQPPQSRMPSSPNVTSFQTAPLPRVLSTSQQIYLGPMPSSVIGFGYPITLCSGLVNQGSSTQGSLPSPTNPIPQQTSTSISRFGVNSVSSPHSAASSSLLLSSNSSALSKTPMDPPSKEPESSKDQAFHLTEVVKPASSNALNTSLTDISSTKKVMDTIPDSAPSNLISTHVVQDDMTALLEYDHDPLQKRKRELSVPAVHGDQFVSQGCEIWSPETSAEKRTKIENKCALLTEIKTTNSKLVETSIDVMIGPSEDDINIPHEGTIVKCSFRNVCSLLCPSKGASSEKMPEFLILLLVPEDYPASSPRIVKSSRDVLNNEPWGPLYDQMLTMFNRSLSAITGIPSLGDMARNWDASARAIMTEFLEKKGGKSFSAKYASWDKGINSSSNSN